MSLRPWLSGFRARLNNSRKVRNGRTRPGRPVQLVQSLEERTLLTATALVIGTDLTVLTDADEAVSVRANATNGNAEVLIDGVVLASGSNVPAGSLTSLTIQTGSANNRVDLSAITAGVFTSLTSISVDTGDGDDTITGAADVSNVLSGGDGNDSITGGSAGDTLLGNDGQDTIDGGAGNDDINAGDGDDLVMARDGDDTVTGDDGDDTIFGGAGNDSVIANNGADSLFGEAGDDTLNGDGGLDSIDGGDGNDLILAGADSDTVSGGLGNDTINGQAGNDSIAGDAGDDSLLGASGKDTIDGGSGNDIVNGNSGDDSLLGNAGNDTVFGGSGADSLFGDVQASGSSLAGNDVVLGQSGNDTISGGGGSDSLNGGAGDDVVQSDDVAVVGLPVLSITDASINPEGNSGAATLLNTPLDAPTTGTSHDQVVAADFNGDGFVDLASEVSVTFNDGTGLFFQNPVAINTGATGFMDTGDVDGDGDIDIVAPTNGGDINVLLNDGAGNFSAPTTFSFNGTIFSASAVELGDFDGDGDLDAAATVGFGVGVVSILFNDGAGAFGQTLSFATNSNSGSSDVESADIDADGDLDLLVTKDFFQNDVVVLRNNGNGTFSAPVTVRVGNNPSSVVAGDLDGDGDIDIATGTRNGISVALNNGDGTFGMSSQFAGPAFFQSALDIGIADFDQDGDNDIVNIAFSSRIELYVNDGTGAFPNAFQFADPNNGFGTDLAIADFNQDGNPDVAGARGLSSTDLAVHINSGIMPTFAVVTVQLSAPSTDRVTVEFATADGLATEGNDYTGAAGTVTFLPGQTTQQVSVLITGDMVAEPTENFFVNLTNPINATIGDTQGQVAILDDDGGVPGPSLNINDVSIVEGDTGTTTATFTVSLSSAPAGPVTVDFSVQDETATSGIDFNVTTIGPLSFSPTVLTQTISVDVFGDIANEGDETFLINLLNPVGAVLNDSQGQFTINGDDSAQPLPTADDTLIGGAGNDTILGSSGDDFINGMSGDDSILAGDGNDTVLGGSGQDTIDGGAGNDSLDGQGGADVITGGDGDDEIVFEGDEDGNDTIFGGNGGDTVTVNTGVTDDTVSIGQDGFGRLTITEGTSTLVIDSSISTVNINGQAGGDTFTVGDLRGVSLTALTVDAGVGPDTIDASGMISGRVRVRLRGGDDNDTITGGVSGDSLFGDAGDDSIDGGAGNDSIQGGDGNDVINAQDGDDTADGGAGNDSITGGLGNDSLLGGLDGDTLVGNEGDDTLRGGFGNDNLNGNAGNDSLDGSFGRDSISGGSGDDVADGGRDDDLINGQGGNDTIRGDHGDDTLNGQEGNDEIVGGDGNDNIMGGAGRDGLAGNDGDDLIQGQGGADTLRGNDGNDTIRGGGSNDTLIGDQGDDTLDGDSGNDLAVTGEGADITLDVETIDESFMLTPFQLSNIDGI